MEVTLMEVIKNICYTTAGHPRHVLDVYLPDAKKFPVFVYFHGGGIINGSKDNKKFIPYLQEMGIAVVSANYRLYPEAVFPCIVCFLWVP